MAETQNYPMAFAFEEQLLRVEYDEKATPLFCAKDVAQALGIIWNGSTTVSHVPDIWRVVLAANTTSGIRDTIFLTEQGLYFFVVRSDKPKALPFQMWIAGDVIPSIRKTGSYALSNPKPDISRCQLIEQATKLLGRWSNANNPALKDNLGVLLTAIYAELELKPPVLSSPEIPLLSDAWCWLVKALLDEVENGQYKAPHKLEVLAGREVLVFRTAHFIEHVAQRGGLREEWQRLGAISDRVWKRMLRVQGLLTAEETERAIAGKRVAHMVALDLKLARSKIGYTTH